MMNSWPTGTILLTFVARLSRWLKRDANEGFRVRSANVSHVGGNHWGTP